jgi:iron complex outermembrane recepter protein
MNLPRNCLPCVSRLSVLWFCLSTSAAAMAQTAPSPSDTYVPVVIQDPALEFRQFEKVEITGSSIVRKEQTQALPVLLITREDISRSGRRSVTDVIQSLPSMSNFVESAQFSRAVGGYSSGAIHGLTNGTLILVNGRRLAPFGLQTIAGPERSAVSLNTIPLGDVERIEVLSDGASSLYGSDAIAGVINIILRSERKGFEISAQTISPYQDRGAGWTTQMGWGAGQLRRDGYSVLLSAEMSHQSALLGQDRPYASQAIIPFSHDGKNYKANGISDYLTLSTSPGSYYQASPSVLYANAFYQDGACANGTVLFTPSSGPSHCRLNGYLNVGIYPEQDARRLRANTQIALDDGHTWYADAIYGETQESRATNLWPAVTVAVSKTANQADYQQALAAGLTPSRTTMYWRPDLSPLKLVRTEKNWQFSTGLSGEVSGWDYRAFAYRSQAQAHRGEESVAAVDYTKLKGFTRSNLTTALNDANPLTAQLQGLRAAAKDWEIGKTELTALEFRGSRPIHEMDGKDVMLGLGLDLRHEETAYQKMVDIDAPESFRGKRRVTAAYTELMVPVTTDWDINFGLRHDNYNDVGTTDNGKISSRWAINSQWTLRGAWGTGFRAPTVGQTQLLNSNFRWARSSYTNPCTPELVAIAVSLKNQQGQAGRCSKTAFDFYGNGNPDLQAEKSKQGSLGIAFMLHRNLRLSLDYWRVKIDDAIESVSDAAVVQNPNAYRGNFILNSNNNLAMYLPLTNVGEIVKSGIDLEAQWRVPTNWGRVGLVAQGTYMLNSKHRQAGTSTYTSDLGRFSVDTGIVIPRFKSRVTASMTQAEWTGSLSFNHVAGYVDADIRATNLETLKIETVTGRKVPSFGKWDVTVQYAMNKQLDFRVAVLNIMNQEAPLSFAQTSTQIFGANTVNSNLWGRTIQAGMTVRF